MPARAPASIDMLQTVMRSSIDRARMTGPAYSMACPTPPPAPMRAMMARITSLAAMPGARTPVDGDRASRGACAARGTGWPARAPPRWSRCRRRARRTRRASAVWESPHTSEDAGLGRPLLGADHVHDALARLAAAEERDAEALGVPAEIGDHAPHLGIRDLPATGRGRHVVVRGGEARLGAAHRRAPCAPCARRRASSPRAAGDGRRRAALWPPGPSVTT